MTPLATKRIQQDCPARIMSRDALSGPKPTSAPIILSTCCQSARSPARQGTLSEHCSLAMALGKLQTELSFACCSADMGPYCLSDRHMYAQHASC